MLDDILKRLGAMPDAERIEVDKLTAAATAHLRFLPNPGPQTEAYLSQADVLLYGGAAGGGKSACLVGIAANDHQRSLILRRESVELDGIEAFAKEVLPNADYNGTDLEFKWNGRSLKLGGCREAGSWSKYAGRARDFIGFDEAGEFLEEQVASLIAWNRSPIPGQRCRVVLGSNPPRGSDGLWMLKWFAPWIDPLFPDPAKPGELRWAVRVAGEVRWVDGPGPVTINGEEYRPLSYTFIPAMLADNPYNNTDDYRARLMSLPEPLRSQLLKGSFGAGRQDHERQIIPAAWVKLAQERWALRPKPGGAPIALGVDVAQGGRDRTARAALYPGSWFAPVATTPGAETPDGPSVAALILKEAIGGAVVGIDMSGGWGISTRDHLKAVGNEPVGVMFGGASAKAARGTAYGFLNTRAEMYWSMREALDPDTGDEVCLPPDPELAAQLCAPLFEIKGTSIKVEAKEDIVKRLGVSPDKADAVVIAWHIRGHGLRIRQRREFGQGAVQTRANIGHARSKTRR
jgi:Terminase large subunit, T4likevirus-type, N-terminal